MSTTEHEMHWTAEEGQNGWRLRYNPTPGGTKNADGSTSHSLTFPVLELTEYVSEPERVAPELARELNALPDMLAALRECQTLLRDLIRPPGDAECIGTVYTRALASEYRARKALELAERVEP